MIRGMNYGLYIHVPCCLRKCSYCDFHSQAMTDGETRAFADALESELDSLPADFSPATIFIGGGTPTALPEDVLMRLLGAVRGRVNTGRVEEWSCEANPGTLTEGKFQALLNGGVNRVSLGIQTFDEKLLKFLNRIHTGEEAVKSFQALRTAGFQNIGADLIYGLPGGSARQVENDLNRLLELGPEHISCYCLSIEPGTALARMSVSEADDEEALAQYHLIRRTLGAAGYEHYEISNFARPGRECRHNLLYWEGGEYIGCGPSAHSHWNGARRANEKDTQDYILHGPRRAFEERLAPEARARETLVMSLRKIRGVSRTLFGKQTGFDCYALCGPAIEKLIADGLLKQDGDFLQLTDSALFVSNQVFVELV